MFDSSTGFLLADGFVRSPDASLVRRERWRALSEAEREGFPPLCPDLVVELASPCDETQALRRTIEVWTAADGRAATPTPVLSDPARLEAGPEFPGLVIDPRRIWEV